MRQIFPHENVFKHYGQFRQDYYSSVARVSLTIISYKDLATIQLVVNICMITNIIRGIITIMCLIPSNIAALYSEIVINACIIIYAILL